MTLPPPDAVAPDRADLASTDAAPATARPGHAWRRWYALVTMVADVAAASAAGLVAGWLTLSSWGQPVPRAGGGLTYLALVGAAPLVWVLVLAGSRAYEQRAIGVSTEEYRRVVNAGLRLLAVVAVVGFVTRTAVSRSFVLVALGLVVVVTLGLRHALRVWLHRQRLKGRFMKRVVVVGTATTTEALAEHLRSSPVAEMDVIGVCIPHQGDDTPSALVAGEVPVLGEPTEVWQAALAYGADTIAIADAVALSVRSVRELAWHLEGHQIDVLVVPAVIDIAGPRISFRLAAGLPLIQLDEPRLSLIDRLLKGTFDRVVAAVALVALAPVLLTAGIVVRLTSPGPAIFTQDRVGSDGRTFRIRKFRTMVVDAEDRLDEVIHLNEADGLLFKVRDDPRITPFGRWLRMWSIDELPQLWNVLRGDMSIVGPRPPLPDEVERYDARSHRRLLMKPGLTGLWQISGRSELSWEEGLRLDLDYIERWSLWTDLVLLAKTAKAVVLRRGAY